jgi:hypothetical protein
MITNQQRAEELLEVLGNSQSHNTAWALKEVLEKLRNQLSGTTGLDIHDEMNVMYECGWSDCLKEIDAICDELELL